MNFNKFKTKTLKHAASYLIQAQRFESLEYSHVQTFIECFKHVTIPCAAIGLAKNTLKYHKSFDGAIDQLKEEIEKRK